MLLGSLAGTLLGVLMAFLSVFLVLLVLVQRGRGGGLTGALGGPGGQSAFGSKAGDTFTLITIIVATIWGFTCALTMRIEGTHVPSASVNRASLKSGPGDKAADPSGQVVLPKLDATTPSTTTPAAPSESSTEATMPADSEAADAPAGLTAPETATPEAPAAPATPDAAAPATETTPAATETPAPAETPATETPAPAEAPAATSDESTPK